MFELRGGGRGGWAPFLETWLTKWLLSLLVLVLKKKIPDSKEGILGWCPGPLFASTFE